MNLLTLGKKYLKKHTRIKNRLVKLRMQVNVLFIKKQVSGKNNKLSYKDTILKNVFFDVKGNNNLVVIRNECYLKNVKFYIRGDNNTIILQNSIKYQSGAFWITCNGSHIEIGEKTTAENNVNMQITEDNMKIKVGNDCMFSSNISIWTQDWHKIYDENGNRINKAKNVIIKNHVWIGYDTKILKGVTIGNNNVIGTNTIVTKSYDEENIIIAGNPGKIVKKGVNWER
jgi:acetyltransferase-like isoleucine patch superfamily enzyme